MKRTFLVIGLICLTLLPLTGMAEVDPSNLPLTTTPLGSTSCTYNTNSDHTCYQGSVKVGVTPNNQAIPPKGTDPVAWLAEKAWGLAVHVSLPVLYFIGRFIAETFLQFTIFFLALAGTLLDASLQITLHMGQILKTKAISDAIVYGWTLLRDIGNLALIAGLVWASIAMILGINAGTHKPGALISNIIIVALLVNFSYFFAGALIDASNSLSNVIYQQGIKNVAVGTVPSDSTLPQLGNPLGISITNTVFAGLFIEKTKLMSLVTNAKTDQSKPLSVILAISYAITLFGMTGVIFTEAAFLIIVRFAIIILLLITSPVFVLGFTNIAEIKKWGDWWWKTMVSQLTFMPVFMLLMMISFNTSEKMMDYAAGNGATLATAIDSVTSTGGASQGAAANGFEFTIFFFISLALLQLSIKAARDLATGAETKLPDLGKIQQGASQIGQNAGKFGQKWIAGFPAELAGFGYRALEPSLPDTSRFGKGISRTFRNWTGRGREVERERRAEERVAHELDEAYEGVAEWQARLTDAKRVRKDKEGNIIPIDPQAVRAAEEGVKNAKAKRDAALKEFHEEFGDTKTARRIEQIGQSAYDAALKAGKTKAEAQNARLDAQDAALHALGDAGEKVAKLVRTGGVRGTTEKSTTKGGAGGGDTATLHADLQSINRGQKQLNATSVRGFNDLKAEEKKGVWLENRDLVADRNIGNDIRKVGSAEREEFGKMLVSLAEHDPARFADGKHDHLGEYMEDMGRAMTKEAYAQLRKQYEGTPRMEFIHKGMGKGGKMNIRDEYENNAIAPSGRVDG